MASEDHLQRPLRHTSTVAATCPPFFHVCKECAMCSSSPSVSTAAPAGYLGPQDVTGKHSQASNAHIRISSQSRTRLSDRLPDKCYEISPITTQN